MAETQRALLLDASGRPYRSGPLDTSVEVGGSTGDSGLYEGSPAWQLWTNPYRAWNPDALQVAKDQADQGNYELCSDLWESMLADDRVSGALEQRILASESLPLHFVGSPRAVRRLERLWSRIVTPGLRAELFRWGMGPGVCPLYVREWSEGEPGGLEVWHPRWLRYYWWERRWKVQTLGGLIDIDSQPGRWFLFTPFGSPHSRPHVTGFWYSVATWWLAKAYAVPDWCNFGQQHASPKWFMEVVEGNAAIPKAEKAQALKWLARIPSRSSMFVPWPFKVTSHETATTAFQTYEREVDKANSAVARRILGHEASMDKDATHASGLTALDVKTSLVRYDVDSEREFWRTGLLEVVACVQGWPGETPYPDRDSTPPEDLAKVSGVQKTAAEALSILSTASLDADVDRRAYLGRYFPLRDAETGEGDGEAPTDGVQLSREDLDELPDSCVVRLDARTGRASLLSGDPGEDALEGVERVLLLSGRDGRTDFPQQGDDREVSLRNSRYETFDPDYVDALKRDWPEIWKAGGNVRGNEQYRALRPVIARGGSPDGEAEEDAVRLREAWAARHFRNKRLAGVVALMKWFVVGGIGAARMEAVVEEQKDRVRERRKRRESSHSSRAGSGLALDARDAELRRFRDLNRYEDDVVAAALQEHDGAVGPFLRVALECAEEASSYGELRRLLFERLPDADPSALVGVLGRAMRLAGLAGAWSGRGGRK